MLGQEVQIPSSFYFLLLLRGLLWGRLSAEKCDFHVVFNMAPYFSKTVLVKVPNCKLQILTQAILSKQVSWFDGYGAITWNPKAARPLQGHKLSDSGGTNSLCLISAPFCSIHLSLQTRYPVFAVKPVPRGLQQIPQREIELSLLVG